MAHHSGRLDQNRLRDLGLGESSRSAAIMTGSSCDTSISREPGSKADAARDHIVRSVEKTDPSDLVHQRVADVSRPNSVGLIEGNFERQQAQDLTCQTPHRADPALTPRPELRRDVQNHRDAETRRSLEASRRLKSGESTSTANAGRRLAASSTRQCISRRIRGSSRRTSTSPMCASSSIEARESSPAAVNRSPPTPNAPTPGREAAELGEHIAGVNVAGNLACNDQKIRRIGTRSVTPHCGSQCTTRCRGGSLRVVTDQGRGTSTNRARCCRRP